MRSRPAIPDHPATDTTSVMMLGLVVRIFVVATCLTTAFGAAAPPTRIAFLDKGEVWMLSPGRSGAQQQTHTGAKVDDFRFSPRGEYLAYAERLRPGHGRPICSIVIVDEGTGGVLTEIQPGEGWIDIDKWLGSTLVYHASAAMAVSGVLEFDAARRTGRELESHAGDRALDSEMRSDGSLLAYVDTTGLGPTFEELLHLVDTATGADVVEVSKRSLMAPAIAPTKDAVAFVEVIGDGAMAHDRVWVYRRTDSSLTMINDDTVQPKSAGSGGLAWSPDSRYVSIDFGNGITVRAVSEPSPPRTFRGVGACWSGPQTLVVGSPVGIDTIDILTGIRQSLVTGGARPQCVDAGTK
jgi:hypothetical protein